MAVETFLMHDCCGSCIYDGVWEGSDDLQPQPDPQLGEEQPLGRELHLASGHQAAHVDVVLNAGLLAGRVRAEVVEALRELRTPSDKH